MLTSLLLALAPAVHAEPAVVGPVDPHAAHAGLPVDQGVGDLDPRGTSLRRLEPGNALYSTRVRLYQMPGAHRTPGQPQIDPATGLALPSTYRYSAPGVQALFDRPDYLMKTGTGSRDMARNVAARPDGAFIETVPAGMVYDLRPETALQHLMPQLYPAEPTPRAVGPDWRIDDRYRIDGRVVPLSGEQGVDRERYPHIPPDTQIPSRLPRRFDPEPAESEAR